MTAIEDTFFLTPHEAETVEEMAARIMPGDPSDPGAVEAGVITYIDRSLEGAYSYLQPVYRQGVRLLDERCRERHGTRFAQLAAGQQDAVLSGLLDRAVTTLGEAPEPEELLCYFASVVQEHTIEGMFCDPAYGGNRDMVGWRLIGFPGARWGYGPEQMRYGYDATRIPLTALADLRRQRRADG